MCTAKKLGSLFEVCLNLINVMGSNFKITFVSEKHVVEDDVLFTNHVAGK